MKNLRGRRGTVKANISLPYKSLLATLPLRGLDPMKSRSRIFGVGQYVTAAAVSAAAAAAATSAWRRWSGS